ncbi:hypothetical protein [Priestia megaterium]|uniref:hypothetical protein n=1 Tax=Priestia megaterium TaxID=1404 RepID=UPI00112A3624|nr:hypothetical protein [Priestia megaterium]TPF17975.1 hypothetical protein CBE78_01755 [Priestia megaterium]TPF22083.1 hypothetical protein CBE79_04260 [Priestia megaterium]
MFNYYQIDDTVVMHPSFIPFTELEEMILEAMEHLGDDKFNSEEVAAYLNSKRFCELPVVKINLQNIYEFHKERFEENK